MTNTYPSDSYPASEDTTPNKTQVKDEAKQATKDVASHGKQAAGDVAATGKQAAGEVVEETKQQASDLLATTKGQLDDQVRKQRSSTIDSLRSLSDQLAAMTDDVGQDGTAVDVATKARDHARNAADWLDAREPDQILDEIRRFGRERPGAFLLGAAVAGVVAGRLTRGAVAVHTDNTDDARPLPIRPDGWAGR